MSMLALHRPTYSPHTRVRVTERLVIAGLRAQERADESEAARDRLAFLFKASQRLAQSLEPATVVDSLLELLVPELADAATLFTMSSGRDRAQTTSTNSERVADQPPEWWSWVERSTRSAVTRATRLGVVESGTASPKNRRSHGADGEHVSFIVVPLRERGPSTMGALRVLSVPPRRFGRDDRSLIEAFAGQAALVLENARLFQEQRAQLEHLEQLRGQPDMAQNKWLRDDERRRIARDLHDYVEQTFFAIALTATAATDSRRQPLTIADLTDALRRTGELASAGAEQLRSAIFALKRDDHLPFGLVASLRTLARAFEQRTGVDTDLVLSGPESEMSSDVSETVLAIAHEALANIERHAHATSVVLTVHFRPRSVQLAVQDDGIGSPRLALHRQGSSTKHFGLAGLRERVRALNGVFSAGPGPTSGFVLRARIPVSSEGTE